MKTTGFVGPSGTGKSYLAMKVAKGAGIEYLIDDGLFISGGRILAGKSAKRESTKLKSVHRAIFAWEEHRDEVRAAIREADPDSILILGTSGRMIEKIAAALLIAPVERFIDISEVASEEEIGKALEMRQEKGTHVVPLPTFEIKKQFSGYWYDALRIFRRQKDVYEDPGRTVVRPTFSYMGGYRISEAVVVNFATGAAMGTEGIVRVLKTTVKQVPEGIEIYMDIIVKYGVYIPDCGQDAISRIREDIERYTAINVEKAEITVRGLRFE